MADIAQEMYPGGPKQGLGNDNFASATNDMNLTPQEQFLYKAHLKNLKGSGGVDNPDGSRSSLYISTMESNGKTYLIPTVHDGKILPPDKAWDKAKSIGLDKFPSYKDDAEASDRYHKMHSYMEKDTADFLRSRNNVQ